MKLELRHWDNNTWTVTTPSGMEHTVGQSGNGKFYIKCKLGEAYNYDSLEEILLFLWGLENDN